MLGTLVTQPVVLTCKLPVAFVAREGAGGRVSHQMTSQIIRPCKASLTDRTDVDVGDLGDFIRIKEMRRIIDTWCGLVHRQAVMVSNVKSRTSTADDGRRTVMDGAVTGLLRLE